MCYLVQVESVFKGKHKIQFFYSCVNGFECCKIFYYLSDKASNSRKLYIVVRN